MTGRTPPRHEICGRTARRSGAASAEMLLDMLIVGAAKWEDAGREGRRRALLGAEDRNILAAAWLNWTISGGVGLCSAPRIGTSRPGPWRGALRSGVGLCSAPRIGTSTPSPTTSTSGRRRRALLGAEDRNSMRPPSRRIYHRRRRALLGAEDRNALILSSRQIISSRRRRALLGAEDRNAVRQLHDDERQRAASGFARRRGSERAGRPPRGPLADAASGFARRRGSERVAVEL